MDKEISETEKRFIQEAYHYLEKPSLLIQLTGMLENPLEAGVKVLPEKVQKSITVATEQALQAALKTALLSLDKKSPVDSQDFQQVLSHSRNHQVAHGIAASLSGVAGGFFGMAALPIELPFTTTLMLRSIAQIAAHFGSDLNDQRTQLDCLFVLSAGKDYYSTRIAFAALAKEALLFLSAHGVRNLAEILLQGSSPILIRLIAHIAARFQLVVAEKFVAQSIPITGAIAGGMINYAFAEHFNSVAKYHFGLKKLEAQYGEELVRKIYKDCTLSK